MFFAFVIYVILNLFFVLSNLHFPVETNPKNMLKRKGLWKLMAENIFYLLK